MPRSSRNKSEERVRLFFGFGETQTGQSQAISGIPPEVPVPKNITCINIPIHNIAKTKKLYYSVEMQEIKLFVFDIDNTITTGDTIWEAMHKACGTWESDGKVFLKMYNQGKITFEEFSQLDVKAWGGSSLKKLERIMRKIKIVPGFPKLMKYLHRQGIKTALVSCSVGQFADYLAKKFGIDYVFANPLVIKDKKIAGKIKIKVAGKQKSQILKKLIKKLKLGKKHLAVCGDSKFDVPMFKHSNHTFIVKNAKYKDEARYFIDNYYDVLKLLKLNRFGQK